MTPCVIHPNKPRPDGYVRVGTKAIYAHRLAYMEAYGPIPPGLLVRHKCDVRNCVNPDHLELGTHADNMRDMRERGRKASVRGVMNPAHRLTEDQVRHIKSSRDTGVSLAVTYGVTPTLITYIRKGKLWGHIQ